MKILYFFLLLTPFYILYGNSPYAPLFVGTGTSDTKKDNFGEYTYDSDGNRIENKASAHEQVMPMGLVNKVVQINQGGREPERFLYGIGKRRYMRIHSDGRKTFYVGSLQYRLWPKDGQNTPQSIVRINANGYSPDIQVELTGNRNPQYIYLLKDHLGSPVVTVDNTGNAQDNIRFEPWGMRSLVNGVAQDLSDAKKVEMNPGFTGHEIIASAHFTHMNGRIQDPQLGQFTGPDPFLSANTIVALNRYCYVSNSPLGATDPTGLTREPLFKIEGANEHYLNKFKYTVHDPQNPSDMVVGYVTREGEGFRRTRTLLPGHTHLANKKKGWSLARFATAFRNGELGTELGGGYVESENFVHVHALHSFKAAGQLEPEAITGLNLASAVNQRDSAVTMNPLLPAAEEDRLYKNYKGQDRRLADYIMPIPYIKDYLKAISLRTGKPIWLEEELVSDFFPWNPKHDARFNNFVDTFESFRDFLEPIVDEVDRELNIRPSPPSINPSQPNRFEGMHLAP